MAADYLRQLQALLPQGLAWPRTPGATLTQYLAAAAEEFARIDARARQLIEEADPQTTTELLSDWERVAGLPDNCSNTLQPTLQGRRRDLVSKLSATGGQTKAYFIAVAAGLGFTIRIREFRPFRIGHTPINEPLYGEDWIFVWRVTATLPQIVYFRIGQSGINEPLRSWENSLLECRLRQLKPAHTILQFAYEAPVLLHMEGGPLQMQAGGALLLSGDPS